MISIDRYSNINCFRDWYLCICTEENCFLHNDSRSIKKRTTFFYTMIINLTFCDYRCKNFGRISSSSYQVRTRFGIYRFACDTLCDIPQLFRSAFNYLCMYIHIYYVSYSIYKYHAQRTRGNKWGDARKRHKADWEKLPRRSAYRDRLVANFRLCSCKLIDAISRKILPKHATLRRVSSVHFILPFKVSGIRPRAHQAILWIYIFCSLPLDIFPSFGELINIVAIVVFPVVNSVSRYC